MAAAKLIDKLRGKDADAAEMRMVTLFEKMHVESNEDVKDRRNHPAESPKFNTFIGICIVVNSILLGVEVDTSRGNLLEDRMGFFFCDILFFVVFFGEMLLRQTQLGWDYFLDAWNVFDYLVVSMNIFDLCVAVSNAGAGGLNMAAVMRICRLLRIVRIIRRLNLFSVLWMVIQCMLDSLRTMLWVSLLLVIIVYCLAIFLTTLVGSDNYATEYWRFRDQYFGSVFKSGWTIVQVVTFDAWASDVARPLADVSPMALVVLLVAIVICSFGVLNVIVAVMVERTLAISKERKDATSKKLEHVELELLASMEGDFIEAEPDENNELDYTQFHRLLKSHKMSYKLRLLDIQFEEAELLFELMDTDRSGKVSADEFIEGLQKVKGQARGQDLVTLISHAQQQCVRACRFVERVSKMSRKADEILKRLNGIGIEVTGELQTRREASKRNELVWRRAEHRQAVINDLETKRVFTFPELQRG
mmetsp:Transcript_70896/g.196981  ORF Transcript_70896/g.196981 Transcript_70896/m.196981 type:complete len:475 (-) Transcript_70896:189-1613(-)